MAHHEIKVLIEEGIPVPQIASAGTIFVGDTVSYTFDGGDVTIEFELPFSEIKDVVREGETRRMTRAGTFFCKCYVKLDNNAQIGWSPERPKAGGEHEVKPIPQG